MISNLKIKNVAWLPSAGETAPVLQRYVGTAVVGLVIWKSL